MEPTLQPGDFIVVNKLCYGARMYKNFKFLDNGRRASRAYRIKGFSKVKHNDVIVFNYPYHKKRDTIKMNLSPFYVKRCIALPGDSLRIVNGFYEVNGQKGFGYLDNQEILASWPGFQGIYRYTISPSHIHPKWDVKDFGPLLIPGKGITIPIDSSNITLYRKAITYETGGNIQNRERTGTPERTTPRFLYIHPELVFHGGRQCGQLAGFPLHRDGSRKISGRQGRADFEQPKTRKPGNIGGTDF